MLRRMAAEIHLEVVVAAAQEGVGQDPDQFIKETGSICFLTANLLIKQLLLLTQ